MQTNNNFHIQCSFQLRNFITHHTGVLIRQQSVVRTVVYLMLSHYFLEIIGV